MKNNNKKKKKTNKNKELEQQKKRQEQREKELKELKIKKEKKNKIINLIVFILYAIFLIIMALHHEQWRDEAQSWLIAKNLSFIKIISQLKYEAHPFMWYYLLRIFSLLGLKYKYIFIIPVLLNLIATYLLLNKSKFNRITTIIIIFSSTSFFYCGVLARSYSLAYLLVIILSLIYQDRYQKPIYYGLLLFAIMNTHILLLGFIGSLVLIDIYEFIKNKDNRKPIIISTSMAIAGAIMIALQFFSTINSTGKTIHFEQLKNIFTQTEQLFMPALYSNIIYAATIITITAYLIYLVNKKQIKELIILLCGLGFQILFATMVYNSVNASSLVYLNILFVLMQTEKINTTTTTITITLFALTLFATCLITTNDYTKLYSDSKNVAKYIEKNVKKDSKIYCELLDYCAAVNAKKKKNKYHFIDYNTEKEYTYTEYGDYYKILYNQTIYNTSLDFLNRKDMDYFIGSIYNKELLEEKNSKGKYELIYETKENIFSSGEGYVIYKHK